MAIKSQRTSKQPTHLTHSKTKLEKKEKKQEPVVALPSEEEQDIEDSIQEDDEDIEIDDSIAEGSDEQDDDDDESVEDNDDEIDEEEENAEGEVEADEENAEGEGEEDSKNAAAKVFFLTPDQLREKEMILKQRLSELTGSVNKNKRKRLFYELKQISIAFSDPAKYIRNPYTEARKKKQDSKRRVQKKIDKKRLTENKKKSDARRERRQIVSMQCLGCKEIGHLVADCPNIKKTKNICYNCGSNEHSLKDCKKPKDGSSLKFASCFVCKGKGHISRDCPKNEKGIYIKGGGCYICGDVHHTQQNCPKNPVNSLQATKTEAAVERKEYKKDFKRKQ